MSTPARILIVDDEDLIRLSLGRQLAAKGYDVSEAPDGVSALAAIKADPPDLVLLDYKMPGLDGLEVLRRMAEAEERPHTVVIFMTAHGTVDSAVEAMRLGAYTYLNKPFDLDDVLAHVAKGLETNQLRREVARLRHQTKEDDVFVVAESPAMLELLEMVRRVNGAGAPTVLLRGESGVGKDLIAHAIHATSDRRARPFQNITCTAIPDNLLESELFGHERGAFTDAKQRKEGLLELGAGGTIFLDEIGDMSLPLQAKMLRFLEERTFRRVGGSQDIRVDVRIIAATNCDLEAGIQSGRFRQDLFYRLAVVPLIVPPLRERPEDILPLARVFADRYAREFRRPVPSVTKAAEARLSAYSWPGNVRELRNVIERAVILGSEARIDVGDLPLEIRDTNAVSATSSESDGRLLVLPKGGLVFEDLERDLVVQALSSTRENQTKAARLLGMTRDQIRYRIEKFGLHRSDPADVR